MKKYIFATLGAVAALGIALPAVAANWVIDFDTASDGSTFASNTIFANDTGGFQRYDSGAGGIFGSNGVNVTIDVESSANHSYEKDLAVGFDSSLTGTRDPDLEDDFDNSADPDADVNGYRNILIIQSSENSFTRSCDHDPGPGGTCDNNRADDEAAGGRLYFNFDTAVDLVGLNVFDFESNQGGKVYLLGEGDTWSTATVLTIPTVGDNGVAFMDFGDAGQDIVTMKVKCYGSCAIDNITGDAGDTPQVPEPGAMALFGIGLVGVTALRRRRQRKA